MKRSRFTPLTFLIPLLLQLTSISAQAQFQAIPPPESISTVPAPMPAVDSVGRTQPFPTATPKPGKAIKKSKKSSEPTEPKKTIHWGGDQTSVNRKTNIAELRGNAYLIRDYEDFRADEIDFNLITSEVNARGRVRYKYGDFFVKADSIYVDLRNKTGTIINGNLTNGQFALRGKRMEQVGVNHYFVTDYDYTTCLDCPNSWEMTGKNADITVEGYAYIKDFIFKVKDASLFWLPYMVIPTKSKRQSGFIFPKIGYNDIFGFHYVQPYFLALNDWADMTFGGGYYSQSQRGGRAEWEGRYALTNRSQGIGNIFLTHDTQIPGLLYRYGAKARVTQELPWNFEGKLRINEVSDSGYPVTYSDDMPGRYEPVLSSDLFFAKNTPEVSSVISFRRIRNLLVFTPDQSNFAAGYDGNTVQEFPRLVLNTNDQFLFGGKVAAGVEARFNRFSRSGPHFDSFPFTTTDANGNATINSPIDASLCDSSNPNCVIREANRFEIVPSLYTTLTPLPWLSVVPSAQYRGFLYNFNKGYNNLARGYLLTQLDMSFQLEKQIPTEDPNVAFKHTFRPIINYSLIPHGSIIQSSDHPFVRQVQNQALLGQYFDDSDITPISVSQNLENYFTPLGNSLTYGFVTQLFRKEKDKSGGIDVNRKAELQVTQTFDITEATKTYTANNDKRVILSPLFATALYQDKHFGVSAQYTYYSYLNHYSEYASLQSSLADNPSPHAYSFSAAWVLEKAKHMGLLWFERSIGLSYSYSKLSSQVSNLRTDILFSVSDYFMPEFSYSIDLTGNRRPLDSKYGAVFQSPSRCWRLEAGYTKSIDRGEGILLDFALNLTGSTFSSDKR
jgi:lipopolysaccharide assembly outer membrane protein LptD (OstA)